METFDITNFPNNLTEEQIKFLYLFLYSFATLWAVIGIGSLSFIFYMIYDMFTGSKATKQTGAR